METRLTSERILAAWEAGAQRRPLDRALAILWAAGAEDDPADWPLTRRDRTLLAVRADTFGRRLETRVTCPHCALELELELDALTLAETIPAEPEAAGGDETTAPSLRPLTSRDLAAVAGLPEAEIPAALRGRIVGGAEVAPDCERRVEEAIAANATAGDLTANLACADCGHRWQETLDPVDLVWPHLEAGALRLLEEVARLARAFGWSEPQVLELGPLRRQVYLRLAGAA